MEPTWKLVSHYTCQLLEWKVEVQILFVYEINCIISWLEQK